MASVKTTTQLVLWGFASVPQHQKCHLSKSSSFSQCPVVVTHTSQQPSAYHRLQVLKEIQITAKCRMCLQFSDDQEIKNIHLFNCTGQGQHGHMVAECRAGFAVLAACFHLDQEGSSALTGLERPLQPTGSERVDVSNESPTCWVFLLPGYTPCFKQKQLGWLQVQGTGSDTDTTA